jgi:hypothetical protein
MQTIAIILALLAYSLLAWWVGRRVRRNLLIRRELNKVRASLKPGMQLSQEWYRHHRTAGLSVFGLGVLGLLLPLVAAALTLLADLRIEVVLVASCLTAFPIWLGWEGIIPLPGLDIET